MNSEEEIDKKRKTLQKMLDMMHGNGMKIKYIAKQLDSTEDPSLRRTLYDAAASVYGVSEERERITYAKEMNVITSLAIRDGIKEEDKERTKYFEEIARTIPSSISERHSRDEERAQGLKSKIFSLKDKAVASILVGGLIFASRTMTGNVVSSNVGVEGEIVGSLIFGVLIVGLLALSISKLTASLKN